MIIFKDPNFSSVSKKKKKADPGQLKAKEEKRKRKLAKVRGWLTFNMIYWKFTIFRH